MRNKYIPGMKSGCLTLIKLAPPIKYVKYWIMQCDCGNIIKRKQCKFFRCKTKSCGCTIRKGSDSPCWTGYHDITGNKFSQMRRGAKSRGVKFNITIKDVWNQYIKQDKKCVFTGLRVYFYKDITKCTASLDRIDSSKPYTVDNIQIIYKIINNIKTGNTDEYFIQMCKMIAENN